MRALICEGIMESLERESKIMLRNLGIEVDYLSVHEGKKEDLRERFFGNAYDFVFEFSFDRQIARACYSARVPYIAVVLKLPEESLFSEEMLYGTNIIFVSDYGMAEKLQGWCGGTVAYFPSGYQIEEVSFERQFISELEYEVKLPDGLSDYTRGFIEQTIKNQSIIGGTNIFSDVLNDNMIAELQNVWPEEKLRGLISRPIVMMEYYISMLLAKETEKLQEKQLFEWCREQGFRLYSCGERVYQIIDEGETDGFLSGIFLAFANKAGYTGIVQPIYDVMHKGGFVLAEYRVELVKRFESGVHVDLWTSIDEQKEKIKYYLAHSDEKNKLAEKGREYIQNFSFTESIENMLNTIL